MVDLRRGMGRGWLPVRYRHRELLAGIDRRISRRRPRIGANPMAASEKPMTPFRQRYRAYKHPELVLLQKVLANGIWNE